MSGLQLFAVSVAVYAVLPLLFALLPSPYRMLLLYTHIAGCLVLGGLLGAVYVLPLHGDVALLAGQVAYGGFMYAISPRMGPFAEVKVIQLLGASNTGLGMQLGYSFGF